jgi:hypothetical protein
MSVPPLGGFAVVPEAEHIDQELTGPYRYRATRQLERSTQTIDRM